MTKEKNHAVIDTAKFLAARGEIELALKLVKASLEKLYIDKEGAIQTDAENQKQMNELELELNRKYVDFRSKLENNKRSYWQIFLKALIISSVISISLIITSSIMFYQLRSTMVDGIMDTVKVELHEVVDQVKSEIPGISGKIKDEIPVISKRITDKIIIKMNAYK